MFWRKRNAIIKPSSGLVYAWKAHPPPGCPTAYIDFKRVQRDSFETAVRQRDRARGFVQQHLISKNPPKSLKSHYAEVGAIWDEILSPHDRQPQRLPTHIIQIGLQSEGLSKSPFLMAGLCLHLPGRVSGHADYCAIEIGGFLRWQMLGWDWADYSGIALDANPSKQWLYQCIYAKWASLRAD